MDDSALLIRGFIFCILFTVEAPAEVNQPEIQKFSQAVIHLTDKQASDLLKTPKSDFHLISEKVLMESAAEKDRVSELKSKMASSESYGGSKYLNQCNHCPKSFKKPSDLVRHVRIHTGEKPYDCPDCHRKFTVKSTLDSHLKIHNPGSIGNFMEIKFCGKF